MASRSSIILGMSPSCSLRPSMSSDIFSWTARLPSRRAAISALMPAMFSFIDMPGSKPFRSSSLLFTWETFGLLRFSSWISARSFFSSFSGIVSVQSLNSMLAMRSSISDSLVKPIDFFILLSSAPIAWRSAFLAPMDELISPFLAIRMSILPENSSSWPRSTAFCAKNSSLPPERSLIFSDIAFAFFCSLSMSSWILARAASNSVRSGGDTRSWAGSSTSFFSAFGFAFPLALGSAFGAMDEDCVRTRVGVALLG
mmetsp:Transcript_18476/g.47515  ORF Transcript_18476/g.47515 Transcript_18476/m.47515 type:complete len:256 (+) Transcript_18476:206-973(+)